MKTFFKHVSILTLVGLFFAAIAGWTMNVVQIITGYDAMTTNLLIVKAVGVFLAPLGAIMGYV